MIIEKSRVGLAVALLATLLATGAVAVHAASGEGPPPSPAWVNPDGSVDEDKIPAQAPVVGPDGNLLRDEQGNVIKVPVRRGPPPGGPGESTVEVPPLVPPLVGR